MGAYCSETTREGKLTEVWWESRRTGQGTHVAEAWNTLPVLTRQNEIKYKPVLKFTLTCTLSKSSSFMFIWHYSRLKPPPPQNNRHRNQPTEKRDKNNKLLQSESTYLQRSRSMNSDRHAWGSVWDICDWTLKQKDRAAQFCVQSQISWIFQVWACPRARRWVQRRVPKPRDRVHTWAADSINL